MLFTRARIKFVYHMFCCCCCFWIANREVDLDILKDAIASQACNNNNVEHEDIIDMNNINESRNEEALSRLMTVESKDNNNTVVDKMTKRNANIGEFFNISKEVSASKACNNFNTEDENSNDVNDIIESRNEEAMIGLATVVSKDNNNTVVDKIIQRIENIEVNLDNTMRYPAHVRIIRNNQTPLSNIISISVIKKNMYVPNQDKQKIEKYVPILKSFQKSIPPIILSKSKKKSADVLNLKIMKKQIMIATKISSISLHKVRPSNFQYKNKKNNNNKKHQPARQLCQEQ